MIVLVMVSPFTYLGLEAAVSDGVAGLHVLRQGGEVWVGSFRLRVVRQGTAGEAREDGKRRGSDRGKGRCFGRGGSRHSELRCRHKAYARTSSTMHATAEVERRALLPLLHRVIAACGLRKKKSEPRNYYAELISTAYLHYLRRCSLPDHVEQRGKGRCFGRGRSRHSELRCRRKASARMSSATHATAEVERRALLPLLHRVIAACRLRKKKEKLVAVAAGCCRQSPEEQGMSIDHPSRAAVRSRRTEREMTGAGVAGRTEGSAPLRLSATLQRRKTGKARRAGKEDGQARAAAALRHGLPEDGPPPTCSAMSLRKQNGEEARSAVRRPRTPFLPATHAGNRREGERHHAA
nr:hypothetical protein Iba_chr02eCG8010 [Ipomoea batatas]